jgi:hypothetical protein
MAAAIANSARQEGLILLNDNFVRVRFVGARWNLGLMLQAEKMPSRKCDERAEDVTFLRLP